MSKKTYSDIVCLVRNEIDSIRKRDGELAPSAYVVMEIATRMKNVQPWDGYDQTATLALNLRGVIEEILKGKKNPLRQVDPKKAEDPDMEVIWISPNEYDNLEDSLGSKQLVGRSVDRCPTLTKKEKLKKKLKQAS